VSWSPQSPDSTGEPDGFLQRAGRIGRGLENLLLALILFAMIGLAAYQVMLRNIVGSGIGWADEALRLMVLWAAVVGAVAASRDNVHLRIDLLSRFLSRTGRLVTAVIVDLFAVVVAGVLAWYSWEFVAESREFGDQIFGDLPVWPFQTVLPAGFVLIAYRYLVGTAGQVLALVRGEVHGEARP
jgi:TRAP-type C4-dicarboxylate transport system permease small subunit